MEEERARELVERYGDLLVRLGYTWLGDLDDAQDVCQTVLLKLLEDQRTFPDQGQERAWVIRLGINVCKDWRKSAWYRRRAPLEVAETVAAPAAEESPLLEQVLRLPQPYRQVIFLRYYEGYPVKEIAALLGKSPALVSTHLKRAREKLKTMLGGMADEL